MNENTKNTKVEKYPKTEAPVNTNHEPRYVIDQYGCLVSYESYIKDRNAYRYN